MKSFSEYCKEKGYSVDENVLGDVWHGAKRFGLGVIDSEFDSLDRDTQNFYMNLPKDAKDHIQNIRKGRSVHLKDAIGIYQQESGMLRKLAAQRDKVEEYPEKSLEERPYLARKFAKPIVGSSSQGVQLPWKRFPS
jgi:hypothetical protein